MLNNRRIEPSLNVKIEKLDNKLTEQIINMKIDIARKLDANQIIGVFSVVIALISFSFFSLIKPSIENIEKQNIETQKQNIETQKQNKKILELLENINFNK